MLFQQWPFELDPVTGTTGSRGLALRNDEGTFQESLHAKSVNFQVGSIWYGGQQVNMEVVYAMRGDR